MKSQEVVPWIQKLRNAIYHGVEEKDIEQIVRGIVQRAKDGDKASIKFVFEYILGAGTPMIAIQNNHAPKNGEAYMPSRDEIEFETAKIRSKHLSELRAQK